MDFIRETGMCCTSDMLHPYRGYKDGHTDLVFCDQCGQVYSEGTNEERLLTICKVEPLVGFCKTIRSLDRGTQTGSLRGLQKSQ